METVLDEIKDAIKDVAARKKTPETEEKQIQKLIVDQNVKEFKEELLRKPKIDPEFAAEIEREKARDRKRKQRQLEGEREEELITGVVPTTLIPVKYHPFLWIVLSAMVIALFWNLGLYLVSLFDRFKNYVNPKAPDPTTLDQTEVSYGFLADLFGTTKEVVSFVVFGIFFVALFFLSTSQTVYEPVIYLARTLVVVSGFFSVFITFKARPSAQPWAKAVAVFICLSCVLMTMHLIDKILGAPREISGKLGSSFNHAKKWHNDNISNLKQIWERLVGNTITNQEDEIVVKDPIQEDRQTQRRHSE